MRVARRVEHLCGMMTDTNNQQLDVHLSGPADGRHHGGLLHHNSHLLHATACRAPSVSSNDLGHHDLL
jgi:hypothetical protein